MIAYLIFVLGTGKSPWEAINVLLIAKGSKKQTGIM